MATRKQEAKEEIFEGTKKYLDLSDEEYEDWLDSSTFNIWSDVADFATCYYSAEIQEAYEKLLKEIVDKNYYKEKAEEIINSFKEDE